MNVVYERGGKLRTQLGHDASGWLRPVRTNRRKEGIAPERAAVGSRVGPGVLRPAEGDAVFLGEVVVAAYILFPPIQFVRLAGSPVIPAVADGISGKWVELRKE